MLHRLGRGWAEIVRDGTRRELASRAARSDIASRTLPPSRLTRHETFNTQQWCAGTYTPTRRVTPRRTHWAQPAGARNAMRISFRTMHNLRRSSPPPSASSVCMRPSERCDDRTQAFSRASRAQRSVGQHGIGAGAWPTTGRQASGPARAVRLRGQGQRSCEHESAILEGFRLGGGRSTGLELHGYLWLSPARSDSASVPKVR